MDADRANLEARILASVIHRPNLAATVIHHINKDLWRSPNAWHEERIQNLAEAVWNCWSAGRDTDPSSIVRSTTVPRDEMQNALAWLLSCYPGEGEASADRLARELAQLIRKDDMASTLERGQALLAGPGDPAELVSEVQRMVAAAPGSSLNIVDIQESSRDILNMYDDRKNGRGMAIGVQTGYPAIDSKTGGLPTAAVTILGARPSQGKTAIASCIALNALRSGSPVIFFSHEMLASDIAQRMACQYCGLPYTNLRAGKLSTQGETRLHDALKWLDEHQLYIIDTGGPTPQECRNTAMYLLNKCRNNSNPALIVVDYIQLEHSPKNRQNKAEELAEISACWVETAKQTGAAILVLAQLNRQADGTQPRMAQLRESGALEQDANTVMLLWRPAKDRKDGGENTPNPQKREDAGYNWALLSVAKSRNSDLCEQELKWEGYCMRYSPWNSQYDQQMTKTQAIQDEYNKYLRDIVTNYGGQN